MKEGGYPRIFVIAALLVAIYAGIQVFLLLYSHIGVPILDVLPPFAIALVLAFLLDPVVDYLQRRGFSRADIRDLRRASDRAGAILATGDTRDDAVAAAGEAASRINFVTAAVKAIA